MRASIDIGSNSCLFLAGEFVSREFKEFENLSSITGLGRQLDVANVFIEEAMHDTLNAIKTYANRCDQLGIDRSQVIATATEASRVAKNANDFYAQVLLETGIKVHIINGEGEAYYTSLGASLGLKGFEGQKIVLMDIGGASTEFICLDLATMNIENSISLPVGVVRLTEWKELGNADEKLESILKNFNSNKFQTETLIGIAGSVTAQIAMNLGLKDYSDEVVHLQSLSTREYVEFSNKLYALPTDQIKLQFPYLSKRAPYLHAGADLILTFLKLLNVNQLVVSTYGVRHGTLFEGSIKDCFLVN